MANLRANNLCGEGGRNAYDGSVYFDGNYSFLSLGSGVISPFGTGDFTIEFWINQGVNTSNYTIIFNLHTTDAKGFEVAFHGGTIQVYTDTGAWRDTGYAPVSGVYEHIVFQRDYSGNTLKMYANGEEKWSVSNQVNYDSTITYVNIGSYNIGAYGHFQGYLSNLRICTGHLVYSSNYFTPPTSPLTVHYNSDGDETVLLCCQDSDDPTQEATGKTFTASGSTSFVNRTDNLVKNGRFSLSATEHWTLSGGTAALGTGQSGTFNDGNHVVLTASSSYAYLKQAFTTVVGRTYRVNCQSNGGDASYISTSTSEGDAVVTGLRNESASGSVTQITNGRFASKSFLATQTTYYVILRATTGGANFDSVSVYEEETPIPPKVIPPYGVDAGNTFNGAISMNSPSYMYFPTGRTEERGRGRGVSFGGDNNTTSILFVDIQSQGNAKDFGDLTQATIASPGACASSTRGVYAGGTSSPTPNTDTIGFITIATTANALDFGNLTQARRQLGGCSNDTRGLFGSGRVSDPVNTIDFITIATTGDASDFGDVTTAARYVGSTSSTTRGFWFGGNAPTATNVINFVTIATTGNASDFGDLTEAKPYPTGCSSSTRAISFGGMVSAPNYVNTIEFFTMASTGNGVDFGDCIEPNGNSSGMSNGIRGVRFAGGVVSGSYTNSIDFINIATTGNASDFGDFITAGGDGAGTSDSHGGLS